METRQKEQLWNYIRTYHPELQYRLQDRYQVGNFLDSKMSAFQLKVNALCQMGVDNEIAIRTAFEETLLELGPSRSDFVKQLIKAEFKEEYHQLNLENKLHYCVLQLVEVYRHLFDRYRFSTDKGRNTTLRYVFIERIGRWLKTGNRSAFP